MKNNTIIIYKKSILLILFLFIIIYLSQASNLRQISNMNNLSNNSIESFYQDKQGRLWIGTCDGLNIYNGREIEVYQPTDKTQSLLGNIIDNILETKENIFWIQTAHEFNKLDWTKKTVRHYNGFKQNIFRAKSRNNTFFIFQEDNFIQYFDENKDSFIKVKLPGISYNSTLNFLIDRDDKLWIIDKKGQMSAYNIINKGGGLSFVKYFSSTHNHQIQYCFYSNNDLFFIDTQHNLYSYNLHNMSKKWLYNVGDMIKERGEVSAIVSNNENIFIGYKTNGIQILVKSNDLQKKYDIENLPINCGVFTLLKDKNQDIVWIGTDGQGVYIHSNDMYTLRSTIIKDYIPQIGKPIRSIYKDKDNTLWLGTKGDGIVKIHNYNISSGLSGNKIEIMSRYNSSLTDNSVYCTIKSKKELLWIGTESGLNYYSYADKQLNKIDIKDKNQPIIYIHDIYEKDSTLWISTVGMGIVKARLRWDGDRPMLDNIKRITINNGEMSSNYFFRIYPENDSIIWFANRGHGAFKMNTRSLNYEQFTFSDNIINKTFDDIFSITRDSKYMYFGSGGGLIKYESRDKFKVLDNTSGFMNNTVHEILNDDIDGSIWVSTNGTLINYKSQNETLRNYGVKDGLTVVEFSDGASFKDSESGVMFFGGVNGFITIQKNHPYDNLYMPKLTFENLTILGKKENINDYLNTKGADKTLILKNSQNFITISVNAIDFLDAHNYTFYYKIDGISDRWIDNGNSNIISLTNMSFGNYKLHVKYINRSVGIASPEYTLPINILPPWYFSRAAYTLYILLFIISVFFLFKYIGIKNEKKRRKIIRILEAQHKEQVYESKMDFFTSIAHEFCTPLTLIQGPCNQIIEHQNNPSITKYAQVIQRNAERLNSLIQDLISFRKIETDNKPPVLERLNISEIVNNVIFTFMEFAKANNARFYKTVPANLIWNSDRNYIITIITNLLSNAFKYMSDGGCVEIELNEESDNLVIKISNTGKGIKEEDLGKIFDRHYILDTLENKSSNKLWSRNGLGLAISNGMVKNLNGSISVTSTINEWTCFLITLPRQEKISDAFIQEIHTSPASPSINNNKIQHEIILPDKTFNKNKQTILVIDDETDILWFISDIFSEKYNVLTISSPLEVNLILNTFHPDIILCDINMPKLNGIELTSIIKSDKHTAHIPLIIVSAKHDTEEQIKGIDAGAELYITKPFNVEYLKSSVERLMEQKTVLKEYFNSPLSAYQLNDGKFVHKDDNILLKEIHLIIESNIKDSDLNANFIAKIMNISVRTLYRKLTLLEYENISDLIRDTRLHLAESLLVQTKKTIEEIIYETGFRNRVSFYKAFVKKYNCTPSEFRKKV